MNNDFKWAAVIAFSGAVLLLALRLGDAHAKPQEANRSGDQAQAHVLSKESR